VSENLDWLKKPDNGNPRWVKWLIAAMAPAALTISVGALVWAVRLDPTIEARFGSQEYRIHELERKLEKIDVAGTDALKIVKDRQDRVIDQQRRMIEAMDHLYDLIMSRGSNATPHPAPPSKTPGYAPPIKDDPQFQLETLPPQSPQSPRP
jgi:hypothetical protein